MSESTDINIQKSLDPLLIDVMNKPNQNQEIPTIPSSQIKLEQEKCKTEQSDGAQTTGHETEMLDMFASVWVKVEVEDNEGFQIDSNEDRILTPGENVRKMGAVRIRNPPKLLKCTHCDYTTKHKNCLVAHLYGHQNKKPFKCEFCKYASKYATALSRHVMVRHNEEKAKQLQELECDVQLKPLKKYKCELCEYKTPYKWNLSSHKRAHRLKDDKQFRCEVCGYATAFKHNIEKHRKTHEETVYTCDKCPFTTKYEGHITRHMVKIHNEDIKDAKLYNCEHCKFGTKYNWRLNIHKNRMKRDVPIKCTHCSFQTFFKCQSKLHKNEHFPFNNQGGYTETEICNFINEKFKQSEEVSDVYNQNSEVADSIPKNEPNIDTFNGKEYFPKNDELVKIYSNTLLNTDLDMNINGYTITTLEEEGVTPKIDSHGQANNYVIDPRGVDWNSIEVIETSDREKPFACTACSYSAKFKASVQRHYQRLHTDDKHKPYRCTNCDFSTKTKDQIALHNKRSQSDVLLICQQCNFSTCYKCTHAMHQKTHYENRCAICNHMTKHKYDMQKHIALEHMGAGAKCRFCNFKTARKDTLLTHEAAHTGLKPLRCTLCEYSAARRSLLQNHYKRYHSEYIAGLVEISHTNESTQENNEELSTISNN